MKPMLSPRELAEAIGVSESSIKRWADDGRIRVARTAGGHRRIPIAEVIRFIRESRSQVVKPEVLGLRDLLAVPGGGPPADEEADLHRYLTDGLGAETRGLLLSLFLGGRSVASLIDGPLRSAMKKIGEEWKQGREGIFIEHRATDLCIQALGQLRLLLPVGVEAPRALGGAPAGDPYLLPTLGTAAVLAADGFHAVNLGPDTPRAAFEAAVEQVRPRLAWMSVSVAERPKELVRTLAHLLELLEREGASLVVGGSRVGVLDLEPHPALYVGSTMAELSAFTKGLSSPPRE
ncbi:MAG: helix-turn-helix domain-containing protein [Candidatus Eisenbacteria bacterium]